MTSRPRSPAPTWEEQARIIQAAAGSWYETFYMVARYTGLRSAQILHLRWEHVDLDQAAMEIPPDLPGSKSEHEQKGRWVPLSPHLVAWLRPLQPADRQAWLIDRTVGVRRDRAKGDTRCLNSATVKRIWDSARLREDLRAQPTHRARIIAANNILNALFMIASSLIAGALLGAGFTVPQIFLFTGLANAVVAFYIFLLVPEYLLRFVAWVLSRFVYRFKVQGDEYLPAQGSAVLACNHVSFVDAVLLMAASPRPIYFVMDHRIFRVPVNNKPITILELTGIPSEIVNVVDIYRDPFGTLQVVINKYMTAAGAAKSSYDVYLLQVDAWWIPELQPITTTPLAKIGHNRKTMLSAELSLAHMNTECSGRVKDLSALGT